MVSLDKTSCQIFQMVQMEIYMIQGSTHSIKNSPNLNIQLPRPVKNVTENITIKNVDENETTIMVINT